MARKHIYILKSNHFPYVWYCNPTTLEAEAKVNLSQNKTKYMLLAEDTAVLWHYLLFV